MCGFAGVVSFEGATDSEPYRRATDEMSRRIARRGPDDDGQWSDGTCRLAFRRLAILDLSAAGHQPMISGDGRSVLVFNGEVYNFPELRAELEGVGVRFRSRSDTEVVLEALARWGPAALARLNGMFALAWWRRDARELLLARDHVGVKPLYYSVAPGGRGIAFASQFDALLRVPWRDTLALDPEVLALYLRLHHIPAPHALYRGVQQLRPGHLLHLREGAPAAPRAWWTLPAASVPGEGLRGEAAVDATLAALDRAVRRQRLADVPLGTFLSGGVDSAIVTALARRQTDAGLRAFTIANPGWGQDEGPAASVTARHLGVTHELHAIAPETALQSLEDVAALQHEPFADFSVIPTLLVSRIARPKVKVALSGDGGDELFYGYERPISLLRNAWAFRLPRPLRRGLYRAARAGLPRRFRLSEAITARDAGDYYFGVNARLRPADLAELAPGLDRLPDDFVLYDPPASHDARSLAHFARAAELAGQLQRGLKKVDMASMYLGLEVRVPMLDREVIDVAMRIEPAEHMAGGVRKSVLRRVLARHVPPAAMDPRKLGFAVPIGEWMRGPWRARVHDLLDGGGELFPAGVFERAAVRRLIARHEAGEGGHKWKLWTLMALEMWARAHLA